MEVGSPLFFFQGLVFTLDTFSLKEKAKLTELITSHGGHVSSSLTAKTTYLIGKHETSEKVAFCWRIYTHILIISEQFVIDSVDAGMKLDAWQYSIFSRHAIRDIENAEIRVNRLLIQALTTIAKLRELVPDYPLLVLPQVVLLADTMKDVVLDKYQAPVTVTDEIVVSETQSKSIELAVSEEEIVKPKKKSN